MELLLTLSVNLGVTAFLVWLLWFRKGRAKKDDVR